MTVVEATKRYEWSSQARCRRTDPELFFPQTEEEAVSAKRICARCPVRIDCLGFALLHGERFGVWGGRTARERRLIPAGEQASVLARAGLTAA